MTVRFSETQMNNSYCSTGAAAESSVRIYSLMDTAMILVVSICVLCLLPLRMIA